MTSYPVVHSQKPDGYEGDLYDILEQRKQDGVRAIWYLEVGFFDTLLKTEGIRAHTLKGSASMRSFFTFIYEFLFQDVYDMANLAFLLLVDELCAGKTTLPFVVVGTIWRYIAIYLGAIT